MKNKVIPRITRRIISICVILSIIVTGIEPWQIVKASDAVHVYTLDELRTAISNNKDIILEEDIKLSDYTFEYSEEYRRIGIYLDGKMEAAYDVDDNKYYEDYELDVSIEYTHNNTNWGYYTYSGALDGNGHKISGYFSNRGLFQEITGNAKSITLHNCCIINNEVLGDGEYYYDDISLLCNKYTGNIDDCSIENSFMVVGELNVGGLVNSFRGNMKNCNSDMKIFSNNSETVGGIIRLEEAQNSGLIENCRFTGTIEGNPHIAAGIVCITRGRVIIKGCINCGNITAQSMAGGIMSHSYMYNVGVNIIEACINVGNISIIGGDLTSWKKDYYVGGILGNGGYSSFNITRCVNVGNIFGVQKVGGVIGGGNIPNNKLNIESCCNKGTVGGTGNDTYVDNSCT